MNRPGLITRWRVVLATLLVAILTLVTTAAIAPRSEAAPGANCSYFSDSSHSTLVGRFGRDCCNNVVAWGIKTQQSECGACFVCTPPPP